MPLFDTSALRGMPWKNGGGITRTLMAWPPGADFEDFDWRVSIAEIARSGKFSRFPGVDRTIILLAGAGMVLHVAGGPVLALTTPFQPHAFSGDEQVQSRLLNGSARDFNVMTRRGRAQARVEVFESEFRVQNTADAALFYCPRGSYRMHSAGPEGPCVVKAGWAVSVESGPGELHFAPETPNAVMIAVLIDKADSRGEDS